MVFSPLRSATVHCLVHRRSSGNTSTGRLAHLAQTILHVEILLLDSHQILLHKNLYLRHLSNQLVINSYLNMESSNNIIRRASSRHFNGSLVFRIDEKLLQRRPPRLTLAATLSTLCKRIKANELDANFVVDILDENRLLPYMIDSGKNLVDVSLGRKTSASKIGDLIVSEECIRGTYELTKAFLEFVLATISNPSYTDSTKTMLASVIYVANEIYPSHHLWIYKDSSDANRILCSCTEIFNHILKDTSKPSSDLSSVCLVSLGQNQAHKQLLDVIVDGKSSIKKQMDELNITTEQGLMASPIVMTVRQSLQIFNQLLSNGKYIKDLCDTHSMNQYNLSPSQYQHGASGSSAPMTNIERALFDTTIRPGLLQHLFSYIYQQSDCTTACLAVELIKKVAKKFSMSLLACLGSEADKVCEFFVQYLGSESANVLLVVAIFDLLSTCVKHQPGLIELFLNYKPESTGEASPGSLEVVMKLLKGCKTKKDDNKLFYSHVMKFVLTFWQKNHSAIEQFDKADQFWDSITHPLVEFLDSSNTETNTASAGNFNSPSEKLTSYILMILAREIFCIKSGITERQMNQNLTKLLEDLSQKNLLGKYSSFVRTRYSDLLKQTDRTSDYKRILSGWRDFLVSYAKYEPFTTSNTVRNQIIEDLLTCIATELRLGEKLDKERIAATGETLLLIWTKWMPKNSPGSTFKSIHDILYLADLSKEFLPFSFLLTFQSTLNLYLVRQRDNLKKELHSSNLLVPAVQLMHFSLKIMEKYFSDKIRNSSLEFESKIGVESRLCLASIMTLRFIIDISRQEVDLWISYMQTNLKTDSLIQFLTLLMNKRFGSDICLSIIELLLCLSSINETASYLQKIGLINQVNMIAIATYERPYTYLSQLAMNTNKIINQQVHSNPTTETTSKICLDNINSDHEWLPIYWHIIRLNISMVLSLGKDYASTAIEFLSIHCIRICELFELLRTKPRSVSMEEALQIIYMINLVLRYDRLWKSKNYNSYNAISDELAKTAYTLATSALPPPTVGQAGDNSQQRTSIRPRDCLVYARCCYDFGKYTEAERVLFQTKFGDKSGFIREASQIYGDDLSQYAFHLASLICLKTNRQAESIDFAMQIFADDPEYLDIFSALTASQSQQRF